MRLSHIPVICHFPADITLDLSPVTKVLSLLVVLCCCSAAAADQDDRKRCINALQKYHGEDWCNSEDRKSCLPLHGAEWCDGSVEAELEKKHVDRQLNDTYRKLLQKASERQRKSIRESQRVWIQYLTLECNARSDMIASGDPVMRNNLWQGCQTEFRKTRIKEFEREYCSNLGGC